MKTYDYLNGTDIYLYQRKDMFRVNSDTALLGKFMVVNSGESLLDIGCNNGALLLYSKGINDVERVGVDILPEAVDLAKENIELNQMQAELYVIDIKDFSHDAFDVIVCNPPYFRNNLSNSNELLKYQRHALDLSLNDLFSSFKRLLKDNGRIYLVHRASYINDIFEQAKNFGIRVKKMQLVYDENKDQAISVLLEMVKSDKIDIEITKPQILKR